MGAIQRVLHTVYPPQCASCGDVVGSDGGLCGPCWRETPFITGLDCGLCGAPLPGDHESDGSHPCCDDCLAVERPWNRGKAVMRYDGNGRRIVLALKHGDRTEIAPVAARWMAQRVVDVVAMDTVVAPIPLHWMRLVRRRYNQSALLAQNISEELKLAYCPDLLLRHRATQSLEGKGRDERFATLDQAIKAHPKRVQHLKGKPVLLVDDVMTSGATFATAAQACLSAGAASVCIVALARVDKDT